MIKLLAFDLDGTIADTLPFCIQVFQESLNPYLSTPLSEEDITRTFGLNEEGMVKHIMGDNWQAPLESFYALYEQKHKLCPSPLAGVRELLDELKASKRPLVLITGKGKRSCAITLKQFGLESFFERVETGHPEKNRKAEALQNILSEYELSPSEILYIGDALSDVTECQKAGVTCLSAAWTLTPEEAKPLEKINAGHVFYSVESLRDFLKKHGL